MPSDTLDLTLDLILRIQALETQVAELRSASKDPISDARRDYAEYMALGADLGVPSAAPTPFKPPYTRAEAEALYDEAEQADVDLTDLNNPCATGLN